MNKNRSIQHQVVRKEIRWDIPKLECKRREGEFGLGTQAQCEALQTDYSKKKIWSGLACGWGLTFFQVQLPRQGALSEVRSWNCELEQNYIFLSTQVTRVGSWWERQHRRNQQDQSSTAGSEGSLSRNKVSGQSRWPLPRQLVFNSRIDALRME